MNFIVSINLKILLFFVCVYKIFLFSKSRMMFSMNNDNYPWDEFSDQPYRLLDKTHKKVIRSKAIYAFIKMFLVNVFVLPFLLLFYFVAY